MRGTWRAAALLAGMLGLAGLMGLAGTARAEAPAPEAPGAAPASFPPLRFLPEAPRAMTLCGQAVPLQLPFVAEQLDREFQIMVNDQAQVVMWLKRAARYFPYIERRLAEAGLPDDLKYLAVAESSLLHHVRSSAGALGLWQFIPGTGQRYGLRRDAHYDDRLDPERATLAAIAYLRELHEEFNAWPLAMAAYNCGEARVRKEIEEQGLTDYFHLYLPMETMRYVYRILAAKAILGEPRRYGYELPRERLYQPVAAERVGLDLPRPLHLREVAVACATTFRQIKELNPEVRGYALPAGMVEVRVPPGQGAGLAGRLRLDASPPALPPAPPAEGDVPEKPRAARPLHAAPPAAGAPATPLPSAAKPAKPAAQASTPPPPAAKSTPGVRAHVVQKGETLSAIAKRHGVTVEALRRRNQLTGDAVKTGQKLLLP